MNKTLVIATCAALSLGAAACGDDDDDAASDDTAALTLADIAATAPPDEEPAGTDAGATDAAGTDTGATEASGTASDADPELVADCEAFQTLLEADLGEDPEAGAEIPDEYRSQLEAVKGQLEDLDFNTELAGEARGAFIGLIDEVLEADTMPEDFAEGDVPEELTEFGDQCIAALGG